MKKLLLRAASLFLLSVSLVVTSVQAAPLPDFSDLIEKASPAVVKITAVTKAKQTRQLRQMPNNQMQDIPEIFRELLEQRQMPQREHGAIGSGFFISSDGYVLTNNHVVSEADEIKVILNDEREFDAKLIGTDDRTDIALLKIDAKNLPQLNLAKNEKLKVGQWVVAIGSPFGLDYSASAGIVSAIGRNIPSDRGYVQFIQTDVAINPGNSGGPLFNMDGEVVGINSQIYTPSGGSVGLSFAIPSSVAIDVVNQLKNKGRVERGWLGVVIGPVDKDLASAYGLDKAQGAIVSEVAPKGPAEKAGVKVGDLIIRFNGQDVHSQADLPRIVGQLAPGTKVTFDVIRKGKRETLSGTLEKLKDETGAAEKPSIPDGKPTKTDTLGLSVAPAEGAEKGVQILSVEPDSAAQRAGLQRGDVITQLDFIDVDSVNTYSKIVSSMPKNTAKAIRFVRGGTPIFRSITIK
ncbi:Do family serine endopeptidase [Cellvibrio sp.]|uniref:Do family serine endopeptidase n=1 Tax=Cellvibrio sp. TaxID=1965322 RepID=UPI00396488E9